MELTNTNDSNEIRPMIYKEARECVLKIRTSLNSVRNLILELYERDGWTALGYKSWRECVAKEFNISQAYLYRQLEAAQIEKVISPIGENEIPESQLRPLIKLKENPDQQREAWQKAVDIAPDGKVTAAIVSKAVKEIMPPKFKEEAQPQCQNVTEARDFANIAISQLGKIRSDDPKRENELTRVMNWIKENLRGCFNE